MVSGTRLDWPVGLPTGHVISLVEKLDDSFFPLCDLNFFFSSLCISTLQIVVHLHFIVIMIQSINFNTYILTTYNYFKFSKYINHIFMISC